MVCKHVLAASALILVFTGNERVSAEPAEKATKTPYIEVSSIRVEPDTIHTKTAPTEAKIIVEVSVHGDLPAESFARVDVGTYSGDPATNKVRYIPFSQGLDLEPGTTVFEFRVRATRETVNGSVRVAASIGSVARGINLVNPPAQPSHYVASLKTVDP
ncbi:MAG: hypothetical protein DMG24_03860 [Acidobacteria bacterium]|nr:MAG: hypothetical protein DMG24_03860 [Acidobacteriota bacterium]